MANNFYQDVDDYFEKHNGAMVQLKELFQKNTNGDIELKNPENGKEKIVETAENMRSISTAFLNVKGTIGPWRRPGSKRIASDPIIELGKGESVVQISIPELNKLTADVSSIKNFWAQKPEKIIQDSIEVLSQGLS